MQKAVAGANRLPTVMSLYAESESMKKMLEETVLLSEELFQLREVRAACVCFLRCLISFLESPPCQWSCRTVPKKA